MPNNVWFIADAHLKHRNILKHQKQRIEKMGLKDENDIEGHDKYIIDMWNRLVQKHDIVYIVGDFVISNKEETKKVLEKLNGKKYLILGNHDSSSRKGLENYFEWIGEMKEVSFKKNLYPFLTYDLYCFMCHYPMKSWNNKAKGALMIYGHTHCNSNSEMKGNDLELNVGLDNPMCNYQLFSLEQVNDFYMQKLNGKTPTEYIEYVTEIDKQFIR